MILPTKHLSQERALLTVGGRLLKLLSQPMTVSSLWDQFLKKQGENEVKLRYDQFVLTLDLLYLLGTIDLKNGLINKLKT